MSCDWPIVRLSELAEITSSKRIKRADYVASGVPFFRSKEVIERSKGNDISTELFISEEQFSNIRVKFGAPEAGDILLTSVGTLGVPYQVSSTDRFYFKDGNLTWLRKFKPSIFPEYVLYWLQSPIAQRKLDEVSIGSTQKALTIVALKSVELPLPPKAVQARVVKIAKSLDQKLETNRRINQTLEQMAQAIFKSWFVDFDPVKAKIAALEAGGSEEDALLAAMQAISGKDTAALARMLTEHPDQYAELHTTAELFPSAMQDSELGEIPSGWSVGTLNDLAYLNKNSWSKRTFPPEIDYVDLANTKNGVIETVTKYLSDDAPSRARRILTEDDTIIGTVRPGNRSFAFIKRPSGTLTGSTGFAVLTPKQKASSEFVYIAATSDESINHLAHLADGGAYPAVRSDVVASLTSIIPTDEVLHRFHDLVRTYFECIANLKIESTSLEQTRDALLPKLLSGELAISDYESEVA